MVKIITRDLFKHYLGGMEEYTILDIRQAGKGRDHRRTVRDLGIICFMVLTP